MTPPGATAMFAITNVASNHNRGGRCQMYEAPSRMSAHTLCSILPPAPTSLRAGRTGRGGWCRKPLQLISALSHLLVTTFFCASPLMPKPMQVMIVEDDALLAIDLADMLLRRGFR
jgi:hypothetical protein